MRQKSAYFRPNTDHDTIGSIFFSNEHVPGPSLPLKLMHTRQAAYINFNRYTRGQNTTDRAQAQHHSVLLWAGLRYDCMYLLLYQMHRNAAGVKARIERNDADAGVGGYQDQAGSRSIIDPGSGITTFLKASTLLIWSTWTR